MKHRGIRPAGGDHSHNRVRKTGRATDGPWPTAKGEPDGNPGVILLQVPNDRRIGRTDDGPVDKTERLQEAPDPTLLPGSLPVQADQGVCLAEQLKRWLDSR